jgi:O-acetyl-ADP-ribose deacetylase (regulator of RNase III)
MTALELARGDITKLRIDAIVNAANTSLLGGGGVDGAIHFAAGPRLLKECAQLGGCPTGEARLTRAYRLHARYVIHAVGPRWQGGGRQEADLLASAYRSALVLAGEHDVRSMAFPAISCGIYGFPLAEAARIAVNTVRSHLSSDTALEKIVFVCFEEDVYSAYEAAMEAAPE